MNDIEFLRSWIRVVVIIAAICTTSLPFVYALSPWRRTTIGRLFMMKAISFAVAIDLNVIFFVWRPESMLVRFWIYTVVLTAIAVSTASMAIYIWRVNFIREKVFWVLLSDATYQFLKKVVQVGLPGIGTLYFTLASIWQLNYGEEVVGTISAVTLFLGLLLGISTKTYNESPNRFDGTMVVTPNEDEGTTNLRIKQVDVEALAHKNEVTFKVIQPPTP